jgi:hypothetical protein
METVGVVYAGVSGSEITMSASLAGLKIRNTKMNTINHLKCIT